MPKIKLHFSAGAYPPDPPPSPPLPMEPSGEVEGGEDGEAEPEEPLSSGGDDNYNGSDKEHPQEPIAVREYNSLSAVGNTVLSAAAEPVAPFRPIRLIIRAPKRKPDELEETISPVSARKKKKRRKSKTGNRRYDSSTSSEETYFQSGFQTLSGRTVINPNSRKQELPPSPSPKPVSLKNSRPSSPSKSKSEMSLPTRVSLQSHPSRKWTSVSSRSVHPGRKPVDAAEEAMRLSILNARCMKCRKAADTRDNKIVFCDGCEKPYHQKCHQPNIDQSYIEVLEKDWFCYKCAEPVEKRNEDDLNEKEEDLGEEGFAEEEDGEDGKMTDTINRVRAEGDEEDEEDRAYLRDLDTASEINHEGGGQEDNGYYSTEEDQREAKGPRSSIIDQTTHHTIQSESMEQSMKQLSDEQQNRFIENLDHSELVDLIRRLRANGAVFDFSFPPGIKDKLSNFLSNQPGKQRNRKRKHPAAAASSMATSTSTEKSGSMSKQVLKSDIEGDQDLTNHHPSQPKRRKFTASEEYWMWREDPSNPAITHIVYENGVGRPAHEVNPPPFPFPGKEQSVVSCPEKRDGEGGKVEGPN